MLCVHKPKPVIDGWLLTRGRLGCLNVLSIIRLDKFFVSALCVKVATHMRPFIIILDCAFAEVTSKDGAGSCPICIHAAMLEMSNMEAWSIHPTEVEHRYANCDTLGSSATILAGFCFFRQHADQLMCVEIKHRSSSE